MDPTTDTTPTPAEAQASAFRILEETLRFYGLVTDSDTRLLTAVQALWTGKRITDQSGIDDIGIALRDNPAFQERFPANEALKAAGRPQFSVTQYLREEAAYKTALQSAGMPQGFYDDPSDFQNFIIGDVSPDEVEARARLGYQAVRQADPQVVQEFQRLYGVSEGELAAYFIDPQRMRPTFDRYEAERQARAAQIAAAGTTQGGMTISQQQAEGLARAGITSQEAQATFTALGDTQELFQPLQVGEQAISQEQQIAGAFGSNAEARRAIAQRRRSRQASFESGGGFAAGQGTQTGLTTVGE
jgi:hypothetical protein